MNLLVPLDRHPGVKVPRLDSTTVDARVPRLGEHTDEILSGLLALDADRVEALARAGVVYRPERIAA